jgi:hypothetical protein
MRSRHFLSALALSLFVAAGVPNARGAFKVVGYEPSWQGSVSSIQFSKITHVDYALFCPTPMVTSHNNAAVNTATIDNVTLP